MTDERQKEVFSRNLTRYMNIRGMNQTEVANAIGVSQQTFNSWIRRIALPRMGKIQKLADYFGVKKSDLLDEKDVNAVAAVLPIDKNRQILLEKAKDFDEFEIARLIAYADYMRSDR